ncbi:MAG: chloride channel protein [Gemmatimonadota bacterium]|jgi:CIC family chloride channel protein
MLLLDTIFLGIVGALAAQLFVLLLRLAQDLFLTHLAAYSPPDSSAGGVLGEVVGPHWLWLVPVATTLGGLISGILVYSLAPEAEGHGTDTAVRAFHRENGFIRPRVTPLKIVASAITIGSGGSAGREGPTALFSAGVGSIYASMTHRTEAEKRLLVLVGMAAGLSAIFRSPIGTAIFAVEVLYGEMQFEAGALIYTMIGSIIAYAVNGLFVGWQPLFQVPPGLEASDLASYAWFVVLGLASGGVGALLPSVFYGVRDGFRKIPIAPHFKPAIGGLGVGLLALALPQVLGGGYGWIQEAIDGSLTLTLLGLLIFAKMLAFALTVSSGGSGGVFAPALFVGAMVGGFLAQLVGQPPAAFAVIGMAAVFGSAARVPIATLLMVTEMTGGYSLLAPAALAVMLAFLTQKQLTARVRYGSLYEAQVPRTADSPAHRMEHLRTAVRMLSERRRFDAASVGHMDLVALLESGIPLDLPDGKQLMIETLPADSSWAGRPVKDARFVDDDVDWEIVAVLRAEHLLLAHPETVLEPEDQVVIVIPPDYQEELERGLRSS